MTIQSLLTEKGSEVVTISADKTLKQAADALAARNFGSLIVSETGRSVDGILSERDIVRAFASKGAAAMETKVGDVMTREVVTCQRSDRIDRIMGVMSTRKFRHIPVIEDGELVGVISMTDIMRRRLQDVEHEATALREFIST